MMKLCQSICAEANGDICDVSSLVQERTALMTDAKSWYFRDVQYVERVTGF